MIQRNPIWLREGRSATDAEAKQMWMEAAEVVTRMKLDAGLLHECGGGICFTKKGRAAWLAKSDTVMPAVEAAEDLLAAVWWSMQSFLGTEIPDTCPKCGAAL